MTGSPIESKNFIVYSDAASVEARHEVATVAEDVWAELLDDLSIDLRHTSSIPKDGTRSTSMLTATTTHRIGAARRTTAVYSCGLLITNSDETGNNRIYRRY